MYLLRKTFVSEIEVCDKDKDKVGLQLSLARV